MSDSPAEIVDDRDGLDVPVDPPSQIIDDRGGSAAFAAKVGRKPGAVRLWKHRNKIPRDAWPEVIRAYPELTLERLIEVEATFNDAAIVSEAVA